MAFQNQQNQKRDYINSTCFQFYNKSGEFASSTLNLGLWDQLISLRIYPAKEVSKQTETSVYDYDKAIHMVFPCTEAITIAKVTREIIVPAIGAGAEATVSFPIGNTNALVISTGVKRFGKLAPYLSILKDIQPTTLLPNESMIYQFNSNTYIKDYDGSSSMEGKTIVSSEVYGELLYFIHAMTAISEDMLGGAHHIQRFYSKRFNKEIMNLYRGLADKIGVEFYAGNNGNGYSTGSRSSVSVFNNPGSNSNTPKPSSGVEPTKVDSLQDLQLDEFMS